MKRTLTAIIYREDDGFVSRCPELGVTSQGDTVVEAKTMLIEAVELHLECTPLDEIEELLSDEFFVTNFEIAVG